MAEAAVAGEVGNGIAIIDHDIEVGQRAEPGTDRKREAALSGRQDGPCEACAEHGLSQ